ncbi:hypothetical protein C100_03715 [Sphingobium sp. C100]|uniref:transporter n=1 Tax=Sphingobium sp. C100 TaxID=1207055 RepID=UPI0003D5E09F|nr:transporter [Sphingobium sp. C100]ETI65172.1 hypothetical protein C100_03715 [Sphingobium sp. C100]
MPHGHLSTSATLIIVAAFAAAAPAHADPSDDFINPDRPGIADGSTTVGLGHFQIETAIQLEYRSNGDERERTTFIPTLLRYGFSKSWEFRVEGNTFTWQRQQDPTQGHTCSNGFAPSSIGLKYNIAEAAGSTQPSIGALVRLFPPSGSGDLRNSRTTGDYRLAADWNFADKWSLNPNVGVAVYEDDTKRSYTAGLFATMLNYNPSKIVNLFIDTGLQYPEKKNGRASLIFDVGAAYIIGHDIQVDLSVGTGEAGTKPPHPFLAAGFSKRF